MSFSELYNALKPLRIRMSINRAINSFLTGMCIGAAFAVIMTMIRLFTPIPFISDKIAIGVGISLAASLFAALIMIPDYKATAAQGDQLGLKERLLTAFELRQQEDPIAKIQRFDAVKAAQSINFREAYPIKADIRKIIVLASLVALTVIALMIPTPSTEIAKQREKVKKEINKQVERIQKERKQLTSNRELTELQLTELEQQLKELEKDLKKAANEAEAIKSLARAQHKLEELKNKAANSDLSRIGEKLSQYDATKELGNALKQGQYDKIQKALEQLDDHLKHMDEKETQQLAEKIKDMAEEINSKSQLAAALQQLTEAMQTGQFSQQIANIHATLNQLAQNPAMQQALQQLSNTMQQSRASISGASVGQLQNPTLVSRLSPSSQGNAQENKGSGGQQDSSGNGQGNGNQNSSGNNGSGSGSRNGNGNEKGNGQGNNGNGSGSSGNGAGNGTGNGTDSGGSTSSSGEGQGKEPGQKQVRDYEQIYASKHLGGDGEVSNVHGTQNDSGNIQQVQVENVPVLKGESLPYNEVYQQYKYEAMNSLSRSSIPEGMKALVEEYFSSLE